MSVSPYIDVFTRIRVLPEESTDLSTCRIPILQLERPKQTGHQRLGEIATGVFSPVLAKHSKHFSLEDALSIGVDRMQRNFESTRRQVESWRAEHLSAEAAKLTIYRAFIEFGIWRFRNTWRGESTSSTSIHYALQRVMQSIFSSAARLR